MATPHHPDDEKPSAVRPVALVTGAVRRIGRVIALELAAAGFDIALHLRSSGAREVDEAWATAAELKAAGAANVDVFSADFADPAATAALVPAIVKSLGRLDAVVNSASRFEYDSPEAFDATLLAALTRSNVAAPVELAHALATQVRAQPAHARVTPCVVNLLDQKLHNPNPDYFSYTLTKAALGHATVLLAQALAPALRVCGVSPGITLVSGPMDEDEFARAHKLTALGRSSTPEDIARAVRFLVESPAITGVDLAVDGGQHLIGQPRDVLFLVK